MSDLTSKFTPYAIIAYRKANAAGKSYGVKEEHEARGDALRHMVWQAEMAKNMSPGTAEMLGNIHENKWIPGVGAAFDQPESEKQMDLYNNKLGREIGMKAKDSAEILQMAKKYIDLGKAQYVPLSDLENRYKMEQVQAEQEAGYR